MEQVYTFTDICPTAFYEILFFELQVEKIYKIEKEKKR